MTLAATIPAVLVIAAPGAGWDLGGFPSGPRSGPTAASRGRAGISRAGISETAMTQDVVAQARRDRAAATVPRQIVPRQIVPVKAAPMEIVPMGTAAIEAARRETAATGTAPLETAAGWSGYGDRGREMAFGRAVAQLRRRARPGRTGASSEPSDLTGAEAPLLAGPAARGDSVRPGLATRRRRGRPARSCRTGSPLSSSTPRRAASSIACQATWSRQHRPVSPSRGTGG